MKKRDARLAEIRRLTAYYQELLVERKATLARLRVSLAEQDAYIARLEREKSMLDRVLASNNRMTQKGRVLEVDVNTTDRLEGDAAERDGVSTLVSTASTTLVETSPSIDTISQSSPQEPSTNIVSPVTGPSSISQEAQPSTEVDDDDLDDDYSDSSSSYEEAFLEDSPISLRDHIASRFTPLVKSGLTPAQYRRHTRGMNRKIRTKSVRIQRKLRVIGKGRVGSGESRES